MKVVFLIGRRGALACTALLCLAGCAARPGSGPIADPIEPLNRAVFFVNETFDRWLLRPLAVGYDWLLPAPLRHRAHDFYSNATYPPVVLNQLLQGEPNEAGRDLGRFLLNSTVGVAGFFDVATPLGLRHHDKDFGQTLGKWGMGEGPYLMLPFWGPSTIRDTLGNAAGSYGFMPRYLDDNTWRSGMIVGYVLERRAAWLPVDQIVASDRYRFVRDAYMQRRRAAIGAGTMTATDPFLDDWEE